MGYNFFFCDIKVEKKTVQEKKSKNPKRLCAITVRIAYVIRCYHTNCHSNEYFYLQNTRL